MIPDKFVSITFPKENEHIFHFLKRFERKALKEGWSQKEINSVMDKAFWYGYHHTLNTISDYCLYTDLKNFK